MSLDCQMMIVLHLIAVSAMCAPAGSHATKRCKRFMTAIAAHEGVLHYDCARRISEILSFIAADNRTAAASVADEVEETILRIGENPKLARVVFKRDVRECWSVNSTIEFFMRAMTDNRVIIRNVRSTKRKRPWDAPF